MLRYFPIMKTPIMKTIHRSTCCAVVLTCAFNALAHDGHRHDDSSVISSASRIWKDTAGKPIHEGSFAAARDDSVIVENQDGDFLSIETERLDKTDRALIDDQLEQARRFNTQPIRQTAASGDTLIPANSSAYLALLQRSFGAFASKVKTRSDARFFYVESDSIPDHQMMVGITAWQQQVPIPQPYTGANAWQIPLHPVKARNPMSAKEHFFRGAIALAANGIPIFNPIKNDGRTDTVVAGELDKWGGHCGRADDYHYHIAPVHLQKTVGAGNPVAFALDGYPVFGLTEPDGSPVGKLDWMNGHTDKNGHYHYHATRTYPYLIGGFYGEVVEGGGQVDPQPRAQGVRPYTQPLRGAKITDFTGNLKSGYSLKYSQNGRDGFVNYKVLDNGNVAFKFIDSSGRAATETFEPRQRGGGGGGGGERRGRSERNIRQDGASQDQRNAPRRRGAQDKGGQNRNRRNDRERGERTRPRSNDFVLQAIDLNSDGSLSKEELANAVQALRKLDRNGDGQVNLEEAQQEISSDGESRRARSQGNRQGNDFRRPNQAVVRPPEGVRPDSKSFVVSSPAFAKGGSLPVEYTGDGRGVSMPLTWANAPKATKCYALSLWHLARDGEKSYWILYNIPADTHSLPVDVKGIGQVGYNDWKRTGYQPMHSQGGGIKEYNITVYALSEELKFDKVQVARVELLKAIKGITLAEDTLEYTYERSGRTARNSNQRPEQGRDQGKKRQGQQGTQATPGRSGSNRFSEFDLDKDGKVTFTEFLQREKTKKGEVDTERARGKFSRVDSDMNGSLSEQELANAPRGRNNNRQEPQ